MWQWWASTKQFEILLWSPPPLSVPNSINSKMKIESWYYTKYVLEAKKKEKNVHFNLLISVMAFYEWIRFEFLFLLFQGYRSFHWNTQISANGHHISYLYVSTSFNSTLNRLSQLPVKAHLMSLHFYLIVWHTKNKIEDKKVTFLVVCGSIVNIDYVHTENYLTKLNERF